MLLSRYSSTISQQKPIAGAERPAEEPKEVPDDNWKDYLFGTAPGIHEFCEKRPVLDREKHIGVKGAHLNPLVALGLFLHTFIPFIWRILSFLPA
jgi:hypothetical protein